MGWLAGDDDWLEMEKQCSEAVKHTDLRYAAYLKHAMHTMFFRVDVDHQLILLDDIQISTRGHAKTLRALQSLRLSLSESQLKAVEEKDIDAMIEEGLLRPSVCSFHTPDVQWSDLGEVHKFLGYREKIDGVGMVRVSFTHLSLRRTFLVGDSIMEIDSDSPVMHVERREGKFKVLFPYGLSDAYMLLNGQPIVMFDHQWVDKPDPSWKEGAIVLVQTSTGKIEKRIKRFPSVEVDIKDGRSIVDGTLEVQSPVPDGQYEVAFDFETLKLVVLSQRLSKKQSSQNPRKHLMDLPSFLALPPLERRIQYAGETKVTDRTLKLSRIRAPVLLGSISISKRKGKICVKDPENEIEITQDGNLLASRVSKPDASFSISDGVVWEAANVAGVCVRNLGHNYSVSIGRGSRISYKPPTIIAVLALVHFYRDRQLMESTWKYDPQNAKRILESFRSPERDPSELASQVYDPHTGW